MNEQEREIATKIWPQHMRDQIIGLGFLDTEQHEFLYQTKVHDAITWLGDRYLLARPINARRQKATTV